MEQAVNQVLASYAKSNRIQPGSWEMKYIKKAYAEMSKKESIQKYSDHVLMAVSGIAVQHVKMERSLSVIEGNQSVAEEYVIRMVREEISRAVDWLVEKSKDPSFSVLRGGNHDPQSLAEGAVERLISGILEEGILESSNTASM